MEPELSASLETSAPALSRTPHQKAIPHPGRSGLSTWSPRVLSLIRIATALLFIEHGTMIFFQFPGAMPGLATPLPLLIIVAAALEICGGGLVLLGLYTRPVAFILSGEMAVGYFIAHFPRNPWPVINQGDAAILYCLLFFYMVFSGGGVWGLDALLRRKP